MNEASQSVHQRSRLSSISESSTKHHSEDDSCERPHLAAPVPVRPFSGLPLSFESLALETCDSTAAQVGQQSPIPASKLGDNEVWRHFAGPSQSNAGNDDSAWQTREDPTRHPRISPGVSTRCAQPVPNAISQNAISPSANSDVTGDQRTPSYDSCQADSCLGTTAASTSGSSALLPSSPGSLGSQGMAGLGSAQSGLDDISGVSEHLTDDLDSRRDFYGHIQRDEGDVTTKPSSEASALLSQDPSLNRGDISASTDSETDSINRRVAGLRAAALKLASRPITPQWRNEGAATVDMPPTSLQYTDPDSSHSSPKPRLTVGDTLAGYDPSRADATNGKVVSERRPDLEMEGPAFGDGSHGLDPPSAAHEKAGGIPQAQSPGKNPPSNHPPKTNSPMDDSEDIWFKYVFSDTNTEDLHKEALDEAGREYIRKVQEQADRDDAGRIAEPGLGYNISVAATHAQSSISAREFGPSEDITSASGVSASRNATIGSPLTTIQSGTTVFDGWEGHGGPPYAASSMRDSMSSNTVLPAHQESSDGGQSGRVMSQSVSDVTSSFSSKAVEAPQSVADGAGIKESFRFAPPKLFVGKLSESVPPARGVTAVKPVTMTKPKRGRPKKKACDGRANIKSIPVYHDDPIEDFDGLEARERAHPRDEPSLFRALDTE